MRFRKKPVEVEAKQLLDGVNSETDMRIAEILGWTMAHDVEVRVVGSERPFGLAIATLEGTMIATPGDWIIRGTRGEFYPCKPGPFADTFEPVDP